MLGLVAATLLQQAYEGHQLPCDVSDVMKNGVAHRMPFLGAACDSLQQCWWGHAPQGPLG